MQLLGFDTESWERIKPRHRFWLGALPICLTIVGIMLGGVVSSWLADYLGVDWYAPSISQKHGILHVVLSYLVAMPLLMLGGALLGCVVNAAVLLLVFGWPSERIRALFLFSEPPDSWLNPDPASDGSFPVVAQKEGIVPLHVFHVLFILFFALMSWVAGTTEDGSLDRDQVMMAGGFLAASIGTACNYAMRPIGLVITEAHLEVIYLLHRRYIAPELVGSLEVQQYSTKAGPREKLLISIQGAWWRLSLANFDPGGTELAHLLMAWKERPRTDRCSVAD